MTNSKILAFTSASLKTGVSSLVVLGLVGCDGLARFNTKKDAPPTDSIVAEESAGTAASPGFDPSTATPDKPEKKEKLSNPLYEWKGDGRKITRIVVNTNDQKARFYSGDEEVGWSTVATGLPKHPTPTGRFQVTEKVENKRSNLYGKVYGRGGRVLRTNAKVGRDPIPDGARFEGAHMPFFMRLTDDGIGLHAGPIPNPGQPASHGCIRMPSKIAPVVFQHVAHGTSVTIEGKGPNYGDYVARQRAEAARRAEARRLAEEQRAAEARKAQQIAQAASAPEAAGKPETESSESHAVAKDEATSAAQKLDAKNARETRMREPAQPDTAAHDADTAVASPETAPAKPVEQMTTPAPEAAKAAAEQQPSIIEEAAPTAPTGGPHPAAREGIGKLGSQPAAAKAPGETPTTSKPAPEIQEAPAPAPKPAERAAEAGVPAPQPASAPTPKPAEPTPSPAPAATPEPPATPAPADSTAE